MSVVMMVGKAAATSVNSIIHDSNLNLSTMESQIGLPEAEHLCFRQAYLKPYFEASNLKLLASREFTVLSPAVGSDFTMTISDEVVTVASVLFGYPFDRLLRSVVVKFFLPAIVVQIACSILGVIVIAGSVPPEVAYATLPGIVFPIMLLLRSHWHIMVLLLQTFETALLFSYSTAFCISVAAIHQFNATTAFLLGSLYLTFLAAVFTDASAVRMDYAFLKGQIVSAALALPQCIITLTCLVAVRSLSFTGFNQSLLADADFSQSVATTTSVTLGLFFLKSIGLLLLRPSRTVSLKAPLEAHVDTLTARESAADGTARTLEGMIVLHATIKLNQV